MFIISDEKVFVILFIFFVCTEFLLAEEIKVYIHVLKKIKRGVKYNVQTTIYCLLYKNKQYI